MAARIGGERDLGQLGGFLAHLVEDGGERWPVEADAGGFLLELDGAREGGEAARHVREKGRGGRLRRRRACLGAGGPLLGLLDRLQALPGALRHAGGARLLVAEHVGMAADHLRGDGLDDIGEGEGAGLLGEAGVIDDLEQEVAELVLEIDEILALDGVGNLVGFLDRVGRDGAEGLLEIPGATGDGRSQRGHDLDEAGDVARGRDRGGIARCAVGGTIGHGWSGRMRRREAAVL